MALAPKNNSALRAYAAARKDVRRHGALPVPLEVRNAVTALMKASSYGAGYRYPHEFERGLDPEHASYLPEVLARSPEGPTRYVEPGDEGWEADAWARLQAARARGAKPPESSD